MKLSNEHRVLLNAALNSAFEEKDDLSSMLRLRLGKKYDDFAGDGLSTKIVSIISKAESQNWIFDLIKASRAQNPTNIALEEISTIIIKNYNEETNVDNTEIIPQEIVNFPENI